MFSLAVFSLSTTLSWNTASGKMLQATKVKASYTVFSGSAIFDGEECLRLRNVKAYFTLALNIHSIGEF
jgi:hypothetical protein